MKQFYQTMIALGAILMMSLSLGCGSKTEPSGEGKDETPKTKGTEPGHPHDHPEKGIHEGPLAEWGKEEYHPELILDAKNKKATVYILDSTVKKAVPIDAQTITLVLKANKPATTIQLKAEPQKADPAGKSSRFVGTHEQFGSKLDVEQITVIGKVNGTPYEGTFHDPDHAETPPSGNIKSEKVKP